MKKRIIFVLLAAALVIGTSVIFAGCDNTSWDIGNGDSTVTAELTQNDDGYTLTVKGRGAMKDFASAADQPWYDKVREINEVVIKYGVTSIGSFAFAGSGIDSIVISETVKSIGKNALPAETSIFLVSDETTVSSGNSENVYHFSESYPTSESGSYWHYDKNEQPAAWKHSRVLFVGNSFTFTSDVPALFDSVAKSANMYLTVESLTSPGWKLEQWASSTDSYGKQLDAALKARSDYDYIILQEYSTFGFENYTSFLNSSKALKTKIDETQTDAKVVLYATWGYGTVADRNGWTLTEMELKIRNAYNLVADEIDAYAVSQVGKAFTYVNENHTAINMYDSDRHHQSYDGSFLAACVHLATIFGEDPRNATFTGTLTESTASTLKEVAYNIVFEG